MSSFPSALALATVLASAGSAHAEPAPGAEPAPRPAAPPARPLHLASSFAEKPGGRLFLPDPHQGGSASEVRLTSVRWGRLVDVHDVDQRHAPSPRPLFEDFVIHEGIQSDGVNYVLETHPITQETRLVIQRRRSSPEFAQLLAEASDNLPPIPTKGPGEPGPFGVLARNATLVLQVDDLLQDDARTAAALPSLVRIATGIPARVPFSARIRFDPNHGGVAGGAFHSTRVLVDMTVTPFEAASASSPLPVNVLGLPPSPATNAGANVLVEIPTAIDAASGQFEVLRNLAGAALAAAGGPVGGGPTAPVQRAMRSGGPGSAGNGFLVDLDAPVVLSTWSVVVENAEAVGRGELRLDLSFATSCAARLRRGDVLSLGAAVVDVLNPGEGPNPAGRVLHVRVRPVTGPLTPAQALGAANLHTRYDAALTVDPACWLSITPRPTGFPASGVSPDSQVGVLFSEPIAPESVSSFDTLRIVRGDASVVASAKTIVVGDTLASPELARWTVSPLLPLAHAAGASDAYHVEVDPANPDAVSCLPISDLAGNALASNLPPVDFTLDPAAPEESNGGIALRFESPDEVEPFGKPDLRGQFFYDLGCGEIRPRPVAHFTVSADRSQPVPSLMIPLPTGTPA